MDYDLISNYTIDEFESSYFYWTIYPHEIVYAIISFFSLCAHGLVIFTIIWKKSLRTPTNLFLLNVLILDALFIIISPANMMIPLHYIFSPDIYCITYDIESTMQSGVIVLLILFSFKCSVELKKYLLFIIGTWIIIAALCAIFIVLCALDIWTDAAFFLTFFSFTILILVHIICRIAFWKNFDICPFRLNIVTVYWACWILCWICVLASYLETTYHPGLKLILAIFVGLGYSYGIINLFALAHFDKKFKTYMLQAVTCTKYRYADFEDSEASGTLVEDQEFTTQSAP